MNEVIIPLRNDDNCPALKLKWISPGKFTMGDYEAIKDGTMNEREGEFEVIISKGYWIGMFPITQCQWLEIMETNPSHFQGKHLPVGMVNWWDAMEFCAKLDISSLSLPDGYICSLPTEAQWEYACRAGTRYKYQLGDSLLDLSNVAWHSENTESYKPQKVGLKTPNKWEIYDMLGNVMEWCYDSQIDYPVNTTQTDWVGGSDDDFRTLRGGCARSTPDSPDITCGGRFYGLGSMPWTGFRICLRPKIESEQEDE